MAYRCGDGLGGGGVVCAGYTLTDLGTLGGTYSYGFGINDAGQVVGYSSTKTGYTHAFLYSGGAMQDLGTLGGWFSYGYGINDAGQVVGGSDTNTGAMHAFLYSGGAMTDLNSLLDPGSGWLLREARGINDAGWITGTGIYNGQSRAFLLTPDAAASPVPEPGTLTLLTLGGLGLVGRGAVRWRRKAAV